MSKTYVINARIVDGTGSPALEDSMLVLNHNNKAFDEDKIEYAGKMRNDLLENVDSDDKVIDLKNEYTVLPGIFNMHVHLDLRTPPPPYKMDNLGAGFRALLAYRRSIEAIECGVTTLRNVGSADYCDVVVRKAIEKNMLCGPRIIACGGMIIAHDGHWHEVYGSKECSGVADFRKATREHITNGVDMIKLCYTGGISDSVGKLMLMDMLEDEISAVVEVSHGKNKLVAAHLSNDIAIKQSIRLGVDCVEHAYAMEEDTAKMMAEKGVYLTPTLNVSIPEYIEKRGCPMNEVENARITQIAHRKAFEYALKYGVTMLCGTDILPSDPVDGTNATVKEIELMVDYGMNPLEAIKAATLNGAKLCNMDKELGSVEAGKKGDFIICHGNPDKNISDLRNTVLVAKNCRILWSSIPGYEERSFSAMSPGYKAEGGVFTNWSFH